MKEKIKNYHRYRIKIKNRRIVSKEKENKNGKMVTVNYFEQPVTNNKLPKIYVVKYKSDIIYVGITSQPISRRISGGLKADGKHGYYGYGFKNLESVNFFVFWFPEKKLRVETIEAEIVYLIRNKTGEWPKCQTEIHFHNATESEKEIAVLIYTKIGSHK